MSMSRPPMDARYECIALAKAGAIARITLMRSQAANAIDAVMAAELASAAAACDRDRSVKAVVLTGSGKFFSAGGDLKAMMTAGSDAGAFVKNVADDLHRAISTFARMEAPLIVAVNGVAAGAGFSLAIAGDLVIASDSASFTMAYTRAGLSPNGSSSFVLPRLIGLRKTQELMLTNRTLSAQEALDWGLVNSVVPEHFLEERTREWAERIASGAGKAQSIVKKLLLSTFGNGLEEQMEIEGRLIAECVGSPDGQEGLRAFREKRTPQFDAQR